MNWFKKLKDKVIGVLGVSAILTVLGFGIHELSQPITARADAVSGYYGPGTPVINSARSTQTNMVFGPNTNGIWPNAIVGGVVVTNLIKVDVSPFKEVTVETIGSPQVGVGLVAGQQVVWTIYKNVSGGNPTNATGTGLPLEVAGLITNRFAASAAANIPVASSITLQGANAGAPQTGQAGQLGGITTLYIGQADATTLTNGTYFTNYSVWVGGK